MIIMGALNISVALDLVLGHHMLAKPHSGPEETGCSSDALFHFH